MPIHNEKKLKNKNFQYFEFFSKSVLSNRKKVSPLFLQSGWTDRVENFFMSSSARMGCVFCFLRNVVSKKFGSLYNILTIEKKKVFDSVFSILLLVTFVDGIFQKKHDTHPDWVLVTTKKFLLDTIKSRLLRAWGENFWWFLALGISKNPRRRSLRILSRRQLLL
jgi:hypothetical protein